MPPRTTRNAAKGKAAGKKPAQQTIVDAMKRTSLRRKEKAPRHESSESEGEGLSELDEMMESEDDEDDTGGAEESKDGETPSKNSKNMDPSAVLTGSYVLSAGNPSELSRRLKKTWKALQETPNQQQDAGVPLEQLRLVCAELFHEKIIDNDEKSVRSLAACCFAELLRVYAPDMPFKANEELYDAFQLILEQLRCLAVEGNEESNSNASSTDLHNLYILESLANVKSCSLLIGMDFTIDENEEPLLIQLFRTFFSTIRKEHSVKIENLMLSVMVSCVEESDTIDQPLLDVILAPLVHGGSAVDNTLMGDKSGQGSIERGPYHMAQELIRRTNDQLQNHLSHFFNSILVEASTAFVHKTSDLKEHVYTLIYEVHKINSSLLLYVLPNVCMQLQVDEIATRSEAIALMGRLFASAHADYGHDYMKNFRDFLGRFRDVSKEIRLQMVQVCAIIWQRKAELAPLIEKEFIQRLSDPEWEVRRLAVNEVCDLAANAIDLVSEDCLRQVGERMKDKKVLIRKETMTGLSQVYAAHISSHWDVQGSNSQGADKAFDLSVTSTANTKKLGWVPDFVLKCFAYPQEELKLRVIQLLDDILLPKAFAEPTRAKGLAFLLHSLDASSKEALRRILSERAKCNAIVGAFLKARRLSRMTSGRPTGNVDESMLRATGVLERGLAPLFSETSNLGKLLEQLVRWKDQSVFKQLEILCDYSASQQDARSARDRLIKSVGSKTALGDFLKNVCRKLNNLTVSQGTIGTYFGFFIANDMHHHRENRVIVDLLLMVSRITPQLFTEFIHEEFEAILVAAEEEPNEESEEEPRERDSKAMLGLLGVLGQFSKHWSANQAEDGLDKPVSSSIPSEKLRESLEQWCLGADSDDDPAGNSSAALALANFFGYSKETKVLVSKLSTKKVLQSPQSPNAQAILQSLGVFSKIYLPKQLFVPGRKSSEKSKTARNLSDSDGVRATPAKGIRMSTSLSPIKPSGFGGSFLTMSTPPASSKKRKSSVGTPGDRTSPKSSGPLTPNNGKRDSISGDVADDVTPPRRQSLMRQARSQAKTFVDQSSDSEKEPDDVVLGGSVAARRSKRKSPGAASVVSDKISQVTDEEGEKDNDTSSEPSSKKRTAPSPDHDDSEMPTFRASRRRRQI
ncbi:hypothetical protein Poli38472_009162 [Pythium oligandrum]|uniref:Sister chromatid cohesion protein PDS5 n=1 Tax=Pythium oligandrum TaxID=41045 RepID=A0A8K1FIH6_PYTOL|nr:hypothetical protein Poli38472_009162 [Pythium oligandrum]|eukprot:TMW64995.1 hypothetical protein Poli38472_009162 [Pythium oligandrum]